MKPFERVAVLGFGTMGSGIALWCGMSGLQVTVCDVDLGTGEAAHLRLRDRVRRQVELGVLPPAAVSAVDRITVVPSVSTATAGAQLIIEAATEHRGVKQTVLGQAAAALPAEAVLASNTSSYPIDELAGLVTAPDRFLGVHFFHPAELIPGVEIIPGSRTRPDIVEQLVVQFRAAGKAPAVVQSSPGFIANRLQLALFLEALRCVEEGLATAEDIDRVVRSTFGFRLPAFGPFQIADLAGLDVYAAILENLAGGLGERFALPERLAELVRGGQLGVKAGGGFYPYAEEDKAALLVQRDRMYRAIGAAVNEVPGPV